MGKPVNVRSVVSGVAECDPIVLLTSDDSTRRLAFLPIVHNNPGKSGPVKGTFVYQRKLKSERHWEKITNEAESLSKLKAGEGYRLELSSAAVSELINGLMDIQEVANHINRGGLGTSFIPATHDIAPILTKLVESSKDSELITELAKLGTKNAVRINDLVLHARIRNALKYWQEHKTDSVEENWQNYFTERPWILSLICAEPIIIMEAKMYTGGTNASGSGGKTVDYAYINNHTTNTAIIEIKNPTVNLIGTEYRGIYPPSQELSGSVTQVQNYKYTMLKNLTTLKEEYGTFDAVNIPTYVIAGNSEQLNSDIKKRSFELNRKNMKDTIILSFDEVFGRLKLILESE